MAATDDLFAEAQALHRAGRLSEANQRYDRLLAADPHHPGALHMLGLLALQTGQLPEAVGLLSHAAMRDPMVPSLHSNLGLALKAAGRPAEAAASFRRALGLSPKAETHNNLGNVLQEQGRLEEAMASFKAALALNPKLAEAHASLGDAYSQQSRLDEARSHYHQALALQPDFGDVLASLAMSEFARGDARQALTHIRKALEVEETPARRGIFVEIARHLTYQRDDPALRTLLGRAIAEAWSRPARLAAAAAALVKLRLRDGGDIAADPLLRLMLVNAPNTDAELERMLTRVRRQLLQRAVDGVDADLEFCAALAQQCFINEYVFVLADDEDQLAAALREKLAAALAADAEVPPLWLAAVASYFPLGTLDGAAALLRRTLPASLMALVHQQIVEPAEEQRIGAALPALTPIGEGVSEKVRAQYEENPYPRWVRPAATEAPTTLAAYLARKFPLAIAGRPLPPPAPDTLLAGCGTGQYGLEVVRRFELGQVQAVDLSRASLSYAARKAQEMGLAIAFAQADIMQLDSMTRSFALIESSGVLHHLREPFAGWGTLVRRLAPGGHMLIALYSRRARRKITETRAFIAREGFPATPDGIRACRARIMADDPDGSKGSVAGTMDFYSVSACRDLLFHVEEHGMDLPQIAGFLKENGLAFLGFETGENVLAAYRARFPRDPAAIDLGNWDRFEEEFPSTFAAMYQFWVQKNR